MIVYFSLYNNTHRFVQKLDTESIRLAGNEIEVSEPFVLITPTYSGGRPPKPVTRFLNNRINRELMLGVVGGGHWNFGSDFAKAADTISIKCSVPVLHRFNLLGTPKDVEIVKGLINVN